MKKLILSATVAFTVLTTSNIYAQQGFGTNTPDRSSAVDIVSSKRGLLIPRIDIPNLDQAAPVSNPANALMVYNTGTKTAAGFYYWDANFEHTDKSKGRWVRFVSSNSGSAVEVKAGANVKVDKKVTGHDTEYTVSVPSGTAPNQVYVTVDSGKKDDKGNIIYESTWVNPEDFINGSVVGVNGISTKIVVDTNGKKSVNVGLGGALGEATTITTNNTNTLAIEGLDTLTKDNVTGNNIVVMGADGILKQVTPKVLLEDAIKGGTVDGKALKSKSITVDDNGATSLLKEVNIEVKGGEKEGQILVSTPKLDDKGQPVVENGKTVYETKWVDADKVGVEVTNGIQKITEGSTTKLGLGGALTEATTITTDATKTLAISGLTELDKAGVAGNNVVMAGADGVLKETSAENLIGNAIETGKIEAKTLTGNGITVSSGTTVGTTLAVANSLLKDVTLGIADGAITNSKIDAGAVTQDKLYAGTKDATGNGTPAAKGTVPVAGDNGTVTYEQVTGELLNGKALTSPTGSISVVGGENALLDGTKIDIKGGTSVGQVLVTKEGPVENNVQTYITEWVTPTDLGNTVTASNGLTKTGNDITLGGAIDTPTTLAIDNTKGSLAITGLGTAAKDKTNKIVVVQADGKLATVDTAAGNVTINQGGAVNISDNSVVNNYHPSMSEIVIEVKLGATDTNLNLPGVNGTEGQTISVKIVNEDEKHNGYLNIISSEGTIAYGAMPFQGWIIKSNGTKWIVVGRN